MAKKKVVKKHKCSLLPYKQYDCLSMQDAMQKSGWNITAFDLPKAWEYSQGENVKIAVVDSGCDLEHPDLIHNLLPGFNAIDPTKAPVDGLGHGTHVAGILVAENNDIGMVGVCPKAKVIPVKVLDATGNGHMENVAIGIRWAVDNGADLIQMSLGSPMKVQQVRKAIQYAESKGVVSFVAAGNAGNTKDIFYPACYKETISVGAVDVNFNRAKFSNAGRNLDFMAPGVDIFSTFPPNWYSTLSGTSMAAPFVCGVAALLLSYVRSGKVNYKLNTVDDYRAILKKSTTPVNGNDPNLYTGFGIIDPRKFLDSFSE